MQDNANKKNQLMLASGGFGLVLVTVYVFIYQMTPFGDTVDLLLQNVITILSALFAASILTRVALFFEPGEPPRRIWWTFAAALWFWAVAEVVWAYFNMTVGEVPLFSAADILWFGGYLFFTASLASQFRLILFDQSQRPIWGAALGWVGAIILTFIFMRASGATASEDFFVYFYPIADFAVAVSALIIVMYFKQGTFARPWLALFIFVISDLLYIWATSSGNYEWVERSGLITLVVELVYIVAYLFVAWGAFNQYLNLKYGATFSDKTIPRRV
jgi:hypothetical protein